MFEFSWKTLTLENRGGGKTKHSFGQREMFSGMQVRKFSCQSEPQFMRRENFLIEIRKYLEKMFAERIFYLFG
jgi:hypothetical protein